jgi:O-antigen/teichoic acid export membrane protein
VSGLGQTIRAEARDVLIFTGSNLVNRLGSLVLLPLYWTKLSPEDYGVLAVIAIIGAFQTLLSVMSLDLAITRFYYEWSEEMRSRNLGAIWAWNWLVTVAVAVGFVVLIPVLGPLLSTDLSIASTLMLGIASNAVAGLFVIPASTIRIKRLPWLFATYNLLAFATGSLLGLWLVLVQDQGLHGFLISVLASNLVLAVIGGGVMLRYSEPRFSSPGLGEAVRFSSRAWPAALINTAASILDRFLLGLFTSLETLGLYSVALRFADVVGVLHNSMKMAFGPFLMKNITSGGKEGRDLVVAVTPYYLVPYFVIGVGLTLFVGPLVRLVGQPEYLGIEAIVPWLVGVTVLGSLYFYYCNGMFFAKRTDLLAIPAGANLLALIAASILLIGPFQLAGLIASRYIAAFVLLGLSLYLSQRAFYLNHAWGPLLRLVVASATIVAIGQIVVPDDIAFEIGVKVSLFLGFVAITVPLISGRRPIARLRSLMRPTSRRHEPTTTDSVEGPSSWEGL